MKSFLVTSVFLSFSLSVFPASLVQNLSKSVLTAALTNDSSNIMYSYFGIKNALVAGNASLVANKAHDFKMALSAFDMKKLAPEAMSTFISLQSKLGNAANLLSGAKDLTAQREIFARLSDDLRALCKTVKLSAEPIYIDYCPMKKAYWLTEDAAIKNPYFGSAMLSCGSIKETIQ